MSQRATTDKNEDKKNGVRDDQEEAPPDKGY
jgi:hypothetical protein